MTSTDSQNLKSSREAAELCAIREMLFDRNLCFRPNACWVWHRYRNDHGYGVIIIDGHKFPVHRLSFKHFKGLIPRGFVVMHECDNPPCFNPAHLFLGTHQENMQDMVRKGRSVRADHSESWKRNYA